MPVIKETSTNPGSQIFVVIHMSAAKSINTQSAAGATDWGLTVKDHSSPKFEFYLPAVLPDVES
jgi:hypothetical protein